MIGFAELTNWLTLDGGPVLLDINSGSLFHILTIAEYGILDLLALSHAVTCRFLPCDAMHSVAIAGMRCPSVCLSVRLSRS